MGGRGSGSRMSSGGGSAGGNLQSASIGGGNNPITRLMATSSRDPMMNDDIPMNRQQVADYFSLIGYDANSTTLDMAVGADKAQLDNFPDIKRARINAEKLPKTGDSYMDKASNVKDYYMATMASSGDDRATMNRYWATTPGKVDLANFMRSEVEAGLTGSEMKSTIDSMKRRRR